MLRGHNMSHGRIHSTFVSCPVRSFRCSQERGSGSVTFVDAIAITCNAGCYHVIFNSVIFFVPGYGVTSSKFSRWIVLCVARVDRSSILYRKIEFSGL